MDHKTFLDSTLARYDKLISEGRMTNSSKVVPINVSFKPKQWILPGEQVLSYLENARSFALSPCICRSLANKCDKPLDVCFYLNEFADKYVEQGKAVRVSLTHAREALAEADEAGLVHLTLYNPRREVYAVCSCCTCCCHDLTYLREGGRTDLIARSEYVVDFDRDDCVCCNACEPRCPFGAHSLSPDGEKLYDPSRCYGCGLCVTTCPTGALSLIQR